MDKTFSKLKYPYRTENLAWLKYLCVVYYFSRLLLAVV